MYANEIYFSVFKVKKESSNETSINKTFNSRSFNCSFGSRLHRLCFGAAPADTDAQIHVSGTATRSVAPNYAILRLGITSEASTVGAAKTTNDRVMSDLIARLANVGIT